MLPLSCRNPLNASSPSDVDSFIPLALFAIKRLPFRLYYCMNMTAPPHICFILLFCFYIHLASHICRTNYQPAPVNTLSFLWLWGNHFYGYSHICNSGYIPPLSFAICAAFLEGCLPYIVKSSPRAGHIHPHLSNLLLKRYRDFRRRSALTAPTVSSTSLLRKKSLLCFRSGWDDLGQRSVTAKGIVCLIHF